MTAEPFLLLTFPPHRDQGETTWKAASPDIPISDAELLTAHGIDAAGAVHELRLAIAERTDLAPESIEFEPAGGQERRALRLEVKRTASAEGLTL